ncbi:hypothetical protein [uncultured Gammaproteobacteria bacterium]|nr:hypothetical protein [uncultured Gammaproteobacteria bacterium]CAC9999678.1 hypothetical protein [uncultured Gammaproteobacteria bacterium]VVH60434.1 hypothetical protein BAZOLSSOX_246 [uncultured Gammaproteobacteria bacterium]
MGRYFDKNQIIHHHTGGLESLRLGVILLIPIHHHTGGLENSYLNLLI